MTTRAYPLIRSKFRTPSRRKTLLRRQRLVDFVHGNIHHKVILVSAGAGYGKTSLLIDYAQDSDLPICWFSIDANDGQVLTFIEYLVASIRERFPQFGEQILDLLHGYAGAPEAVEPFVASFISEIETHIPEYFVIVLDDYHEVTDSEPVNAFLDGLLRYMPEHGHVVLASRGIPRRLTLTRLASRQEIVGMGVEQLQFTQGEITALLQGMGHTHLTPNQIAVLAERSQGWITGILLTAQAHWSVTTTSMLEISGATGGVFEYLAEEVLDRQPPEIRSFLLGSALLQQMSPPLCDALLGISTSAQILHDLAAQSLFTFPLDAEESWYQYHQLFREFLVAKLERDSAERHRDLCLMQAEVMVNRGQWPQAIRSYLSAAATIEAAKAIEIVIKDTFDAGNWELLKSWISALPASVLTDHPRLQFYLAKAYTEMGELHDASDLLTSAYETYRERSDSLGAARVLLQRGVILRYHGRYSEAILACREAILLLGEDDLLVASLAHRSIGICQNLLGQTLDGIAELREALRLAQRNTDDTNAAYIAHDLGVADLTRGQLITARTYFHQALLHWRRIGNPSTLSLTLQGLASVHQYLGQYAEAENRLQESLEKAQSAEDIRLQAYAWTNQGDLYRDTGRYGDALQSYQRGIEAASASKSSNLLIYLLNSMGLTYRFQGDQLRARQAITEALDQVSNRELVYERGLCHLSQGILALDDGDHAKARTHLEEARDLFATSEMKRDLARTYLYQSKLAYERQDSRGLGAMQEVTRLARELGTHQFIVGEGPSMLPLMQHAQKDGIAGLDYSRIKTDLGQLHDAAHGTDFPRPQCPAESLEFLSLDGGRVKRESQLVTSWESSSARTMAYLFVAHPQGLHRDRVIEGLWPDVSQAKGNSLFHSTMYRLRQALYKDFVVHQAGLYQVNPAISYRHDAAEFQRLVAMSRSDDLSAIAARQQAIDIYRSPFLEMCDLEWCDEMRQALEADLLDLLHLEGQHLLSAGSPQSAESCFLRILSIDPYDEGAHRGIMRCRAERNDRAGALRQFRECTRLLRDELLVEPSSGTLSLYENILSR